MASKDFEKVDKDFDSIKKIKQKISLSDKALKDLQHDAHRFAEANQTRCKPTPRLWKQPVWKTITDEFIENDDIGAQYWSPKREGFTKDVDLEWDEDKDAIRFLCFCVLKCEIKNVQTANKRKGLDEGREETLTPKSKKAKSSTPASKEGGEDDEEAPEKSIEEGEEAEKTAEDKDKAGVQSGKKKDAETPKPKKKPGRPTKTGEPRERYQLGKETKVKEKAAALAKKVEDTAAHVTDHDLMNEDEPTDKSAESVSKKTAGEASVVDALVGVPIKSTETDTGAINVSPTMPASPAGQNSFATPTKLTGTDVRHGEITPSHTPGTREVRGDSGPMLLKFIVTSKGHEDSTVFSEWSNITIQHFLWQAQGNSIGGVRFGIMGALVAEMTIPNGEVISFSLIRRGNIDPQQSWQAAVDKAVKVIDSGSYAEGAEIRLCLS